MGSWYWMWFMHLNNPLDCSEYIFLIDTYPHLHCFNSTRLVTLTYGRTWAWHIGRGGASPHFANLLWFSFHPIFSTATEWFRWAGIMSDQPESHPMQPYNPYCWVQVSYQAWIAEYQDTCILWLMFQTTHRFLRGWYPSPIIHSQID